MFFEFSTLLNELTELVCYTLVLIAEIFSKQIKWTEHNIYRSVMLVNGCHFQWREFSISHNINQISKMMIYIKCIIICSFFHYCFVNSVFDIQFNQQTYKTLPRFWTGSGLSPSAPLPFNRSYVVQQLLSNDMFLNMEYIAALPNSGIQYIRIHWLLTLIKFK